MQMPMDKDPKHTTKTTQYFLKAKKGNILQWLSESPDLNPTEDKTEGR